MSTRSCTTIKTALGRICLYRHMDGYPAMAGASLVEGMLAAMAAPNHCDFGAGERLVEALLALRGPTSPFQKTPPPVYEITTRAEDHGDLEWTYEVEHVSGQTGWRVKVASRNLRSDRWDAVRVTLRELVDLVNQDAQGVRSPMACARRRARPTP